MFADLLKCSFVGFIIVTQVVSEDGNNKTEISDEEAAGKCDWDLSFILKPQTRNDICNIYCIMFYNGHDFPKENEPFPPKEERFRECVQWSNIAGAPGICHETHELMRCVIKQKYGPQDVVGGKKTAFIPLIKEFLNKE